MAPAPKGGPPPDRAPDPIFDRFGPKFCLTAGQKGLLQTFPDGSRGPLHRRLGRTKFDHFGRLSGQIFDRRRPPDLQPHTAPAPKRSPASASTARSAPPAPSSCPRRHRGPAETNPRSAPTAQPPAHHPPPGPWAPPCQPAPRRAPPRPAASRYAPPRPVPSHPMGGAWPRWSLSLWRLQGLRFNTWRRQKSTGLRMRK